MPYTVLPSMSGDPLENIAATDPGEHFEEMCWGLLRRRYPIPDLVRLPATLGGDHGIEGFSKDGIAYQCYADRDSLTLRHRTDKQKQKLTRDTSKLKKNAAELEALLDGLLIDNYVLMVPEFHAAELVAHAVRRAEAVRGFGLGFIGADFAISIKVPQDYPAELKAAEIDGAASPLLPDPAVEEADVDLFGDRKPDLISVLDGKLESLEEEGPARRELRDELVRSFLVKEELMGGLQDWPETWEAVERRRQLRQETLKIQNQLDHAAPNERITALIDAYQADLKENVAGLPDPDAQRIATGQVGDWLMRCPLSFRVEDK
jgi:hypothetical protein